MKTLLDAKYIKIIIDLKSWGIGIDWRHNEITRPYYFDMLCVHFEMGVDPLEEINNKNSD